MLLPYYLERFSRSIEPVLSTQAEIESLLEVAILTCSNVYIVIDGIDECARDTRKKITTWFRLLVDNLQTPSLAQVRCLFVSQDDGIARKDFEGLATLKLEKKDSMGDIELCGLGWAGIIQSQFLISDDLRAKIASSIQHAAEGKIPSNFLQIWLEVLVLIAIYKGMFLLAKLIATNLMHQESLAGLENELQEDILPKELDEA